MQMTGGMCANQEQPVFLWPDVPDSARLGRGNRPLGNEKAQDREADRV